MLIWFGRTLLLLVIIHLQKTLVCFTNGTISIGVPQEVGYFVFFFILLLRLPTFHRIVN